MLVCFYFAQTTAAVFGTDEEIQALLYIEAEEDIQQEYESTIRNDKVLQKYLCSYAN